MSTVDYRAQKRADRHIDERRVQINEVHMANRTVTAIDTTGGKLYLSFDLFPSVVDIPSIGDTWVVCRNGHDWRLVRRVEKGTEQTAVTALQAGDKRLEANGDLHLNGTRIILNGLYILTGNGVPTAVAPVGSLYLRKDGNVGEAMYVMEIDGWMPK
jgi:hypothetical protein